MLSRHTKIAMSLIVAVAAGALAAGAAIYAVHQAKQTRRAMAMTGGDPKEAVKIITRYGCAACHEIPGAEVPGGQAAAPLAGIGQRLYLGGAVANTPENLISWIVNPKQFDPRTAMPVTGISQREARDVAAYLYRLR
jgi:cytochrome c2